jgi:hypothetical protein
MDSGGRGLSIDGPAAGFPIGRGAGEAVQMAGQQPERVRVEPVVGPVAVTVACDQPGRPQRLEVVADQWLADGQLLGEMGHARLLAGVVPVI